MERYRTPAIIYPFDTERAIERRYRSVGAVPISGFPVIEFSSRRKSAGACPIADGGSESELAIKFRDRNGTVGHITADYRIEYNGIWEAAIVELVDVLAADLFGSRTNSVEDCLTELMIELISLPIEEVELVCLEHTDESDGEKSGSLENK